MMTGSEIRTRFLEYFEVKRMSLKQPQKNNTPNTVEIEKLIREQGVKPFNIKEITENVEISDIELEKFLAWRREIRESEKEASKNWQL